MKLSKKKIKTKECIIKFKFKESVFMFENM